MQLTQSLAILHYLDDTRPEPRLIPVDPVRKARALKFAHVITMDIHPVCNVSVVSHVANLAGGGEAEREATRVG